MRHTGIIQLIQIFASFFPFFDNNHSFLLLQTEEIYTYTSLISHHVYDIRYAYILVSWVPFVDCQVLKYEYQCYSCCRKSIMHLYNPLTHSRTYSHHAATKSSLPSISDPTFLSCRWIRPSFYHLKGATSKSTHQGCGCDQIQHLGRSIHLQYVAE
jgi:hypothetical protein